VNSSSVASSTNDEATETLASFPTHLAVLQGCSLKTLNPKPWAQLMLEKEFIAFSFQAQRPGPFNTKFNRFYTCTTLPCATSQEG